jgi:hypothetical protein
LDHAAPPALSPTTSEAPHLIASPASTHHPDPTPPLPHPTSTSKGSGRRARVLSFFSIVLFRSRPREPHPLLSPPPIHAAAPHCTQTNTIGIPPPPQRELTRTPLTPIQGAASPFPSSSKLQGHAFITANPWSSPAAIECHRLHHLAID